jgi:hypothetical protein
MCIAFQKRREPFITMNAAHIYFDVTLVTSDALHTMDKAVFFSRQSRHFVFQCNDLGSSILKFLSQPHDSKSGILKLVQFVVYAFIGPIEFTLQATNLSHQRRNARIGSSVKPRKLPRQ